MAIIYGVHCVWKLIIRVSHNWGLYLYCIGKSGSDLYYMYVCFVVL